MQILVYLILTIYLIFHANVNNVIWNSIFKIPVISGLLIDFLFLYLIIGVSLIDNSIIKLSNKLLSYLGEISYGIYMYHMLVIFALVHLLRELNRLKPVLSSLFFYIVVTVSVIIVSSLSKIVFENYFLNLQTEIG